MYGTIARIHPKPGRLDELKAMLQDWDRERGPAVRGNRGGYLFLPDRSPYDRPTAFLVALFDDEVTYRANAASPEQDAWYRQMRELLEDDPDWSDGAFFGAERAATVGA